MHDLYDERGVPISAGIPTIVRVAAAIGIVIIFTVGGMVIGASSANHAWPSSSSLTVPLDSGGDSSSTAAKK